MNSIHDFIMLSLLRGADIPTPPEGHKWKEVRHDNSVTWLCSWNENVLGSNKYIMLNPSSKIKVTDWERERQRERETESAVYQSKTISL